MDFIKRDKKSFYEARLGNNNKNSSKNRNLEQQQVSLIEHKTKRDNQLEDLEARQTATKSDKKTARNSNELISATGDKMGSSSTHSSSSAGAAPNGKTPKTPSKAKWILISLMGIFFVVTAILIAILSITLLLENEDQCFNENSPFQPTSYKLFATKTLYSTAFNYLNKQSLAAAPLQQLTTNTNNQQPNVLLNNNINNQQNYDKSSINLPKIFSSSQETLDSINERLTSAENGCKVRQFHYFGRHSARLPSSDGIDKINKHILRVQSRIDLAKYQELNNQFSGQQLQPQAEQISSANSQPDGSSSSSNKSQVCFDPLVQYKQWTSFASPEQGNLVMESGARETMAIARRFKSIYPQMFDSNLTKIVIGTTDELRTAQTALTFLKQFDNFALDFCGLDEFPSEDTKDKNHAEEIRNSACFKEFLQKYSKEKLYFHKNCRNLHKEEVSINHNFNLKDPNRTEFISLAVSKKLKLNSEQQLTSEETYAIYNACRYESALTGGTSIWCNLFTDKQLKFFELLTDIDDYFNQAYGHPDQSRSACPITTELIRTLKSAQRPTAPQTEAHFYFTHSEVIQRLLAASIDLEQDAEFAPKAVLEYLRQGQVPKWRQWQTSLFTPFSANMAFTLYSCPKAPARTNIEESLEMDVASSPFKVVASLNEQPILLEGCPEVVCDLFTLSYEGRLNREKKCKLDEICKNNVVFS